MPQAPEAVRVSRGINVAGKTGTAQVISLEGAKVAKGKMDVRDHGWFVFFAPHDKPEIAGVIFAEHAEHGYLGAPIAKYAMETYFAKKEGRPLPTLQPKPAPTPIVATNQATATEGRGTSASAEATADRRSLGVGGQFRVSSSGCSNDDSSFTSTGCCWPRFSSSPGSGWR